MANRRTCSGSKFRQGAAGLGVERLFGGVGWPGLSFPGVLVALLWETVWYRKYVLQLSAIITVHEAITKKIFGRRCTALALKALESRGNTAREHFPWQYVKVR